MMSCMAIQSAQPPKRPRSRGSRLSAVSNSELRAPEQATTIPEGSHQEQLRSSGLLRHPKTGEALSPTLSPREAADVLKWPERTVRDYARKGLLPTMERPGSRGQYRIVTALLLEMLGLPPNIRQR